MGIVTRGFGGRRQLEAASLPPGQHLTDGFPVLTAGPTQYVDTGDWSLTVTTETGEKQSWSWADLMAMSIEDIEVDIHCVTRWSKLATRWRGVPVDAFFEKVESAADYVMAHSYGGYTTNLPLEDLLDRRAWVAFEYDDGPLPAEHGGPVRLLVPHLYFWKSAKWLNGFTMMTGDEPGFWEGFGYHNYGDPWREERYDGD
ncbi:MAG TPA: sulfite oxidase-like oxidoreductase [Nocardioides sp.]|uniref:sulfite oxidase-like oxidoreductase n=1 Tax=Nocardioides sp. TaxID=35761 RepID=UPI002D7FA056|nr:sulfite oxidase-like oxidoreductase [Nocardioides sp.]HET6653229.1 sulfite oxidase-like oxidoreductase [Nocardioides sp.]